VQRQKRTRLSLCLKYELKHADLIVRAEGAGQKPIGMEALKPLAVRNIALASRHILHRAGIDKLYFKSMFLQDLKRRNPVHAR
jgi:hypothetical protein